MAEGEGWRPPRPCEAYRAEWELCRSAGHFLRHYYVHGERPACGQWRRDLASCREWEERRSAEAQVSLELRLGEDVVQTRETSLEGLLAHPSSRHLTAGTLLDVQERLEHNLCPPGSYILVWNTVRSLCESERARVRAARKHGLVWVPRQSPPEDWHFPLPEDKDG